MVGRLLRLSAFAVVAISASAAPRPTSAVPSAVPSDALAQRYYPEVRLRKMHLVRPDLIPYPISFEVYC